MGKRWFWVFVLAVTAGLAAGQSQASFTAEERAYLQKVSAQGGLRAALRGYDPGNPGSGRETASAFHRDLFLAFAKWLGVRGTLRSTTVAELFGDGKTIPPGIFDNPNLRYDPAVFSNADLALGSLTPLPWRNRIMTLVPFVPSSDVLLVRKDSGIRSVKDLDGRKVLVQTGSSFVELWKSLQAEQKIQVKPVAVSLDDPTLEALAAGKADAVLEDSFEVFSLIRSFPDLKIVQPVSDIHYLAWAVKKGNDVLAGLLTRFLRESSQDGTLNRLVRSSMSVDLPDYLAVLGLKPGQQVYHLLFTLEERKFLEDLQARGVLKAASMVGEMSYSPQPDGRIKGFDYRLARALARTLGVRLEVLPQTDPTAFFTKGGVFNKAVLTDPNLSYEPDLFAKADLYATPFALVPWRQKLCLMVPILPYGNIIVGKNAEKILKLKDLGGKRILVQAGTYQEQMVKDLLAREGVKAELVPYPNGDDPLAAILAGRAEVTIDGVQFFAVGMKRLKESRLTVSPLKIEGGSVAWAVSLSNPLLASIVKKFVIFSQSDGSFAQLFLEENGMDFGFYLELIGT